MNIKDKIDIKSIISAHPKLNELSEHQLLAVEEAIEDGAIEGHSVGYSSGGEYAKSQLTKTFEDAINMTLAIRSFFCSASTIFIACGIINQFQIKNIYLAVLLASFTNVVLLYTADNFKKIVEKLIKKK